MVSRAVRHGALLLLFLFLLLLGLLVNGPLNDPDGAGAYHEDQQDQREPGVLLSTLLHSPSYWRSVPLDLDRKEFPHVSDAFYAEYVRRTTAPQFNDVRENRTLLSPDFFDELQLWRRPGSTAASAWARVTTQLQHDRVEARAVAKKQRGWRSWTSRAEGTVLKSLSSAPKKKSSGWLWWLSPSPAAPEEEEVEQVQAFILEEAKHPMLHYSGGKRTTTTGSFAITPWRPQPISLATDEVQLVPYPLIPPSYNTLSVTRQSPPMVEKSTATIALSSNSSWKMEFGKGKLRYKVPHRVLPHTPTHGWNRFYIALNLWKNEKVLPDLTEALVVFLTEEVVPYFPLNTSVVVSIFANVSPDRTAELIGDLLIPRLHAIGVRTVYATTEGSCLGYVQRQPFHERIEWMACIRNKALGPLYEYGMRVFDAEETVRADELVVLFFNDIFFRPQDITTLLESTEETTMAQETRPQGWLLKTTATTVTSKPGDAQNAASATQTDTAESTAGGTTFDLACGMDFYYTFYDTWVTRDRLGAPFAAQMPYSDDHATQDAFFRILQRDQDSSGDTNQAAGASESASVPVKCCWNGIAAIRGRFFLPPEEHHQRLFPAVPSSRRVEPHLTESPVVFVDHRRGGRTAEEQKVETVGVAQQEDQKQQVTLSAPQVLRRHSGALYDRVGNLKETLHRTGMEAYYTRVLTRRLQAERTSWHTTRATIAKLTSHPFYKDPALANVSSFAALLRAVLEEEKKEKEEHRVRVDWEVQVEASTDQHATVADDSVYYAARHPALRFRHALTPSYGATVSGLRPVRDGACLSSECLLICQDLIHAAILQDGRAPVILLNPHVRVAYELPAFLRLTEQKWFFQHPYVYRAWTLARRTQLWWLSLFSRTDAAGCSASSLHECGDATSALDDWLTGPSGEALLSSPSQVMQQTLSLNDGRGVLIDTGVFDLPTLTRMDCQRVSAGSFRLAAGAFFPLFRISQLLVVASLLRWVCWQIEEDVVQDSAAASQEGISSASLSVEERWWQVLYHALWYSSAARRVRHGVELIVAYGRAGGEEGGSREVSGGDSPGTHSLSRGRAGGLVGPATPVLQLQLRQYYRRRKVAVTLGGCAQTTRRGLCCIVHFFLWLLGTLCCVRWWCGCRPPTAPHVPAACADSSCGRCWARYVELSHVSSSGGGGAYRRDGARSRSPVRGTPFLLPTRLHSAPSPPLTRNDSSPSRRSGVFQESPDDRLSWPLQRRDQERQMSSPPPHQRTSTALPSHLNDESIVVLADTPLSPLGRRDRHTGLPSAPRPSSPDRSTVLSADFAVNTVAGGSGLGGGGSSSGSPLMQVRPRTVNARAGGGQAFGSPHSPTATGVHLEGSTFSAVEQTRTS